MSALVNLEVVLSQRDAARQRDMCGMQLNGRTQWEDHKIGNTHKSNLRRHCGASTTAASTASLHRAGMGKSVGRQLFDTHLRQLRGSVSERRLPGRYAPDVEGTKLAERLRHFKNKATPEQVHELESCLGPPTLEQLILDIRKLGRLP